MTNFSEYRAQFVRSLAWLLVVVLGVIIIALSVILTRTLMTEFILWQTTASSGRILQGILLNSFVLLMVMYMSVRRVLGTLLRPLLRYAAGNDRASTDFQPLVTFLVLIACIGYSFAVPEAFASAYEVLSQVGDCLDPINEMDFKFFSFTTFTTLGYGNVVPVGQCRGVAMAEAMMGMLVLPLLIAQGLYTLGEMYPRTKG